MDLVVDNLYLCSPFGLKLDDIVHSLITRETSTNTLINSPCLNQFHFTSPHLNKELDIYEITQLKGILIYKL